jgi:TPR repeat protein
MISSYLLGLCLENASPTIQKNNNFLWTFPMIKNLHSLKNVFLISLVLGSLSITGCQKQCPYEKIQAAADLYPALPVPKPPHLSNINGQQIVVLIDKANKGNETAQNELVKRYHWANFPSALLRKLHIEKWKNVEERAKNDYQLAYVLVISGKIQHYPTVIEHIKKQAERKDAAFQNLMGILSAEKEAWPWYKKAAEQGFAPGQLNLAYFNIMGTTVPKDLENAFFLMEMAAEQGYPVAQYYLGLMYARGEGVFQNPERAMEWYRKSAEQGFVLAQGDLGEMYLAQGDAKNDAKWLEKAASQGDVPSQLSLSKLYAKGQGVPKNINKAKKLEAQALKANFPASSDSFQRFQLRLFWGMWQ